MGFAAATAEAIWSQPAEKTVTFATSFDAAEEKFRQLLDQIGLDAPKELDQ